MPAVAEACSRSIKLAIATDMSQLGRFLVTKQPHDIGAFRTMDLRNLFVTEPYFHDGSQKTMWDTLDHYNKGGVPNPFLDGGITPLGLSEKQEDDLAAFLLSPHQQELHGASQGGVRAPIQRVADRHGRSATPPRRWDRSDATVRASRGRLAISDRARPRCRKVPRSLAETEGTRVSRIRRFIGGRGQDHGNPAQEYRDKILRRSRRACCRRCATATGARS